MHVTEITVSAGRVVSHPLESYANLRPQVTLKAVLAEGEDHRAAARTLQAQAEELVEDHKNALLANIIALDELKRRDAEIASLEKGIRASQARLDELRSRNGDRPALVCPAVEDDGDHEHDERPARTDDF